MKFRYECIECAYTVESDRKLNNKCPYCGERALRLKDEHEADKLLKDSLTL